MKVFNTIGHFFAWTFHAIVGGVAKAGQVAQTVENAAASPLGSAIASIGGAKGAQVQADIEAVAGAMVTAAGSVGVAALAKAANIADDVVAVQALERLVSTIGGLVSGTPAPVPAAPAAA